MARALRREGRGWPAEWEKRGSHPGTQAWSPPLQPPIPSLTALDTAKASFAVLTSTHQGPGRAPGSRRKQEGPYRSFYSPVGPMLAFGSPGVKAVGGREHGQGPSLRADKPALRQGDWTQAWGSIISHHAHSALHTGLCGWRGWRLLCCQQPALRGIKWWSGPCARCRSTEAGSS